MNFLRTLHPQWSFTGLAVSLLVWAGGHADLALAQEPPNLVLIIADDMAWDDAGFSGNKGVVTPNLDRLAAGGMRFTNAFLTASSCSPSRCSIITGRYPHQTGAEELHWPLPENQITFVEKLREAGYWTAAAGKWHLGEAVRDRFDVVRETDTSGFQLPTGEAGQAGEFVETMEGEAQSGCTEWVPLLRDRPNGKPFFLWLAALDPHRPYHDNIVANPTDPAAVRLPPYHLDLPEVRKDYAHYYDEINRLDKYVGMVMKELERQGIIKETLILFLSDNGRPFPRDKTTIYDSGIRTPFIVHWPDKVVGGSVSDSLVSAIDIAPTFINLAGGTSGEAFQGVSFLPILRKSGVDVREFVFAEQNWHDYEAHNRAVRDQRFKLIRNGYTDLPLTPSADGVRSPMFQALIRQHKSAKLNAAQSVYFTLPRPQEELYDCASDPHELNNLVGDKRFEDVHQRLRAALEKWITETHDYVPELRTADEFDRSSGLPTAARVRPRLSKAEMVKKGLAAP